MGRGKQPKMISAGLKSIQTGDRDLKAIGQKQKWTFKFMKVHGPGGFIFAQEVNSGEIFIELSGITPGEVFKSGHGCLDYKGKILIPMAFLEHRDGEAAWSEIKAEINRKASH